MNYTKFENYLLEKGCKGLFVSICLRRIQEVEKAYGLGADVLVQDDAAMDHTLRDLEWKVGKDDLDNYQNVLRHYYEMIHGKKFIGRAYGNRRLK